MLKEVAEKLKNSNTPVMQKIHTNNGTKLIAFGLKKGVALAEHTAPSKAKIIMVQGEVDFNMKQESYRLATLDTYDIPLKEKHAVVGVEDAIFLLLLSE